MSDRTHISWSDATWNVVTGCTRVSPGCDHCYIERTPPFRMAGRQFDKPGIGGTTGVQLHPERLDQPLRWRKPRRIFVCSLADLFHDHVPDDHIVRVFAAAALAPQHVFQFLTKRPTRMRALLASDSFRGAIKDYLAWRWVSDPHLQRHAVQWPLPNAWIGVSVENQQWADIRIPALLDTPAAVRFLSCEPLLGPVDLLNVHDSKRSLPAIAHLDWVIVGGESGRNARPMQVAWARSIRDQCTAASVAFHFKQWGEWAPEQITASLPGVLHDDGSFAPYETETGTFSGMRRVGKKAAGRELDGREWSEYPA